MTASHNNDTLKTLAEIKERMDELEMKLAFQDDLVNSLNDVIARQDREILRLWDANKLLKQSIQEVKSGMDEDVADVPPPHY